MKSVKKGQTDEEAAAALLRREYCLQLKEKIMMLEDEIRVLDAKCKDAAKDIMGHPYINVGAIRRQFLAALEAPAPVVPTRDYSQADLTELETCVLYQEHALDVVERKRHFFEKYRSLTGIQEALLIPPKPLCEGEPSVPRPESTPNFEKLTISELAELL
eukprot:TRINITY_DN25946_c0_g1_i1.p2 TRINITY_DN25946_c0_g1~~TRINITY_DN25946_c0_g1_i1.p2  ORF type:complete len:179 (+),score=34.55 TRINITY_DN25946_c0_g1_i1:58-537(+)